MASIDIKKARPAGTLRYLDILLMQQQTYPLPRYLCYNSFTIKDDFIIFYINFLIHISIRIMHFRIR